MNKSKMARRMCTAALASALTIALSSCTGATNTYGKLDEKKDTVYASSNGCNVTYGELWDELQWSSESVLENQITNVVLQKYFNNIYNVMNKKFADLTADELTAIGLDKEAPGAEDSFNDLKEEYSERLVDYVLQDVFSLSFDIAGYKSVIKNLESYNKLLYENKYIDNIYSTYHITEINNKPLREYVVLEDMGADVSFKDNFDNYLAIANSEELRQIYYVDFAKELLAFDSLTEEVNEANEADEDDDDDKWGYFSTTDYISMFKEHYTNLNKVNAIVIKFTSTEEFEQTLRAFGIRYYKDKFYFIDATSSTMSYDDYIKYYDDFQSSQLSNKAEAIDDMAMIEIYTQMYNYYYGGYRTTLRTGNVAYDASNVKLDNLRKLTRQIIDDYSIDTDEKYENAVKNLIDNYDDTNADTCTLYSKETSDDISKSLTNFLHETLSVEDYSKRYSSSTTSINDGYYAGYKLADQKLSADDDDDYETLQKYLDFYNTDRSNYEILSFIQKEDLQDTVERYLKTEKLTESNINSYITTALEDVKVKIYNEPTEIAYLAAHSTYSKTLSKNSDSNVLASITYDDVTYNIQIVADNTKISEDTDTTKTLTIPGNPDKAFGVFDELERTSGTTTSIDLISKKLVKQTKSYEEKAKDRDKYLDYIDSILYQFSNGAFESNGYPSSIGKYNFLMLYFHTAVIDEIIDNYYKVQFASVDLLTDYSSDKLIDFFADYSQNLYDTFFSLSGTRMVVYFDGNDDSKADKTNASNAWQNHVITAEETDVTEFIGKTREYVAKQMITEIYTLLAASTSSHSDKLSEIVTEIQGSAKVEYENNENPLASENRWAKYLHLGLKVKTADLSVSNTSTDVDFNIKQRVYDYARGHNDDNTKTYQYFLNQTTPTCFMETLTDASLTNDDIVMSEDGYNLILITSGTAKSSAEFTEKKNSEDILTNIYFKYNDNGITIENIYNDGEQLNKNQIKYYVLDYAINNSSTIIPESLADAYNNYLSSIVSRFTSSETQRIVLLSFIRNKAGLDSSTEFYDVVKFDNESYNGVNGIFNNYILINQKNADNYNYIYNDTTGTSNPFDTWWDEISQIVDTLLLEDK